MLQLCGELLDGQRAQIDAFTGTDSNGSSLDFPISNNQEIGNLEQGMLADFKADLFVSQVNLGTKTALIESFLDFPAKSACLSVIFMITAWVGASQAGKEPA